MKNTKIEWAHHSVNFWWGCVKVSAACMHCYAELLAKLFSRGRATWGATGARWVRDQAAFRELYALHLAAVERGVRERVFINSMSDTFEERADLTEARESLWNACRICTQLDILLLTKRPENVMKMVPTEWHANWPAHVWVGTTVENHAMADERLPHLIAVPARVKFLSCEPLLGELDLMDYLDPIDGGYVGRSFIDWVIVGGESGGHARPMHPDWVRKLREDCAEAGVPFFFKQWGEWAPGECVGGRRGRLQCAWFLGQGFHAEWHFGTQTEKQSENCHRDDSPDVYRVGKAEAGRRIDGNEHNEVPVP